MTTSKQKLVKRIGGIGCIGGLILYLVVAIWISRQSKDLNMLTRPAAIQAALKANPNDEAALRGLAFQYKMAHNYTLAIATYQHLLEVDPGDSDSHFNLGICFQRTGDTQDAILQFQNVVKQNGTMAGVAKKIMSGMQNKGNA